MTATEGSARPRIGILARMLRSPLFAVIAGVVALAVIAGAVVVYVTRFDPFASAATSQYAPSAFPSSLSATTSPLVSRGGTVTLGLQAYAPDDVAAVEVWDGDRLYYRLENPPVTESSAGRLVDIDLDWVATTAGSHVISTRTIAANGQVSLADPVVLPVLDLDQDLVPSTLAPGEIESFVDPATGVSVTRSAPGPVFVRLASAVGDTAASIAARLALDPAALMVNEQQVLDATLPLPFGSSVRAPLVAREVAKAVDFGLADVSKWATGLTGSVTDCVVTIGLDGIDTTMALYATSPFQPGYTRVGDVSPGQPWSSATMPIGPTMYVAYEVGATHADTGGPNAPTAPLYLAVPSSCADKGWTGDARVVNGALVTDVEVESPYAYISIDQQEWVRVPAGQGQYLASGSLNDIRSSFSLSQYDQVDVEVWSFDGAGSSKAAVGQFCRAGIQNASPANEKSFGLAGECSPAGSAPTGDTSLATTGSLTISVGAEQATAVSLTADTPLSFTATLANSDASRVVFQFSYLPLQQSATALSPPGVLHTQSVGLTPIAGSTDRTATTTINLWKWRNAHQVADTSEFSTDGENLQLDDEIALALANERLRENKSLVDTVYVRAIAARDQYYGPPKPIGPASTSITIDMDDPSAYPGIAQPTVGLRPGLDVTATDSALRNKCFDVLLYPEPNTWGLFPDSAPVYDAKGNVIELEQEGHTDLEYAEAAYPRSVELQCLWPGSDAENARFEEIRRQNAADCGLDCFLFSVFVGSLVGFAAGGPVGALIGAGAGAAIALAAPGLANAIFSAAKQYWDLVAQTYNVVMGGIVSMVTQLNLVCVALKEAGEHGAADKCTSVTGMAASATITALTGLPPRLPMSSALVEIAKGELHGLVVLGIDSLLGAAGFSCGSLTVDSSLAVAGIEALGDKTAKGEGAKLVDAARTDTGSLSLCDAAARLLIGGITATYAEGHSTYTRGALETEIVNNTIVEAVSDAPPFVTVTAPASADTKRWQTCPLTVNATVTKAYLYPDSGATAPTVYSFDLVPLTGELMAVGAADAPLQWKGEVAIPVLPYQVGIMSQLQLRPPEKSADPTAPFLEVFVDSPCFASTYRLTAATEMPTGSSSAFTIDNRSFGLYMGQP